MFAMQSKEMPSIERQDRAIIRAGESEYLVIGNFPSGLSRLLGGQDIVSEPT
jgi:hypothetical protein